MPPKSILVADDEPHLTFMLAHALRGLGIEVRQCANGAEALEAALAQRPDLVITDYQMPAMSGVELCLALRRDERTSTVPVIMVTGRSHRLDPAVLSATNIQHLMVKPFSIAELIERVNDVVDVAEPGASQDGRKAA